MSATTYTIIAGRRVIEKGDQESLDYGIDYADLLDDGETISDSTWTVPEGLTAGIAGASGSVVTQWLSGGTAGQSYDVDNVMTTSAGRVYERSIRISVVARK
jgi:hypothetical protein